jgi:hypothetical protein
MKMLSIRHWTVLTVALGAVAAAVLPLQPVGALSAKSKITRTDHFAGYEVTIKPTTATATVVVPAITCTASFSAVNAYVGFNNYTAKNFTSGGVAVGCSKTGTVFDDAYTEINNTFYTSSEQIRPGDTVTVTVVISATNTEVTVADATNGSSTTTTVDGPGGIGGFQSVSIGAGGEGKPMNPPPDFGSIGFSGVRINGKPFSEAGGPTFRYEWYHQKVLIVAASIIGTTGETFTTSEPS